MTAARLATRSGTPCSSSTSSPDLRSGIYRWSPRGSLSVPGMRVDVANAVPLPGCNTPVTYPPVVDLAGFIAVATLVVVTPGPDMTLVARNTFTGGRPSGLATSAGTCSGLLVHAAAAGL